MSITGLAALFLTKAIPLEVTIYGISKDPIISTAIGTTTMGPMLLVPGMQATLVSHSFVRKLGPPFDVSYDKESDAFIMQTPDGDIHFTFDEETNNGLPTATIPELHVRALRERAASDEQYRLELHRALEDAKRTIVAVQSLLRLSGPS